MTGRDQTAIPADPRYPDPAQEPGGNGVISRLRRILAPRARLWGYMVPLHLLAFLLLYLVSVRLMVNEIVSATSDLARTQLDHQSREVFRVAPGDAEAGGRAHSLDEAVQPHENITYRIFLPGGRMVGAPGLPMVEHKDMVDFLAGTDPGRIWLSEDGDRRLMRGLKRLVSTGSCTSCHQEGQVLAIMSMSIDLSESLDRAINRGRRNMFLIIVLWATVLTVTTVIVRRSIQRSTKRFEKELEAAGTGVAGDDSAPRMVLDPTTARLQVALREFLRSHRERQKEVASRLAHTDQLASLGQLAAGLAHEIKNPLAGIRGALEILEEDEGRDSTKLLYSEMLSELERVNSTLQTLLKSARPSPPRISENDAGQLVEDVQRLLSPGLRRREIALETNVAAGDLHAMFDPSKIRQVLINLVQNAADAIGERGRIEIGAMHCPDGTGVIFVVVDDGPGIGVDHQKNIFTPFFTTKFSGTGLGLAISRSLVEQHGGTLEFESEPGEGTTFYVILPESPESIDNEPDDADGDDAETTS